MWNHFKITDYLRRMVRLKDLKSDVLDTNLRRCLSTLDVAFLGIGNMLGSGIYVLSPELARDYTGPALVISYMIAGITSLFAALAYAEFAVRYPRAGSAYSYTYFSVGELMAFFVGWNVIMENVLSLAVIARSCSEYADSLVGGAISNMTIEVFGTLEAGSDGFIGHYPNVLAAMILVAFLGFMMLGAKETSWLNNILVFINIAVIAVILGVGGWFADLRNWEYREGDPKPQGFINGFLPFGWKGVFAASSQCFFAYVGFDGMAAAGEEARDPKKAIPAATFITMSVVSVVYIAVSAVLTLMLPYYNIHRSSGIPDALGYHEVAWAQATVSIGAMICMATAIIGTIYGVSRVIYAMADDGLLPTALQKTYRKVPIISMLLGTLFAAATAVVFNVGAIIEMLSIGTLFAYLLVAFAVLVVRHTEEDDAEEVIRDKERTLALKPWAGRLRCLYPSGISQRELVMCVLVLVLISSFGTGFALHSSLGLTARSYIAGTCGASILLCAAFLYPLAERKNDDKYKMPLAPLLPIVSIFCNVFLMTTLKEAAWERLGYWMAAGFVLYVSHGIRHSKLGEHRVGVFDHSSVE
ncbi:cationic amino acid transporter 4 [Galendromus occidentalis]|uniref:Cationic amino acid transporter 4 n=1 Tax=Galendromus occidentalis TaxID=34638 RepID=A0AAJ7L4R3_9ACAR|nr:cationic amino acid transporter 4 [Galendromus occidentalis]